MASILLNTMHHYQVFNSLNSCPQHTVSTESLASCDLLFTRHYRPKGGLAVLRDRRRKIRKPLCGNGYGRFTGSGSRKPVRGLGGRILFVKQDGSLIAFLLALLDPLASALILVASFVFAILFVSRPASSL